MIFLTRVTVEDKEIKQPYRPALCVLFTDYWLLCLSYQSCVDAKTKGFPHFSIKHPDEL